MKKILIYYNFVIIAFIVITGFIFATRPIDLLTAILFYPIFVYFALLIAPKRQKAIILPKETKPAVIEAEKEGEGKVIKLEKVVEGEKKFDLDRRAFIKLIGSAGTAAFIFSIFGIKKAEAAFFGSVPGPGIVGVKNIAGVPIDPAEKHPTDGYRIAELDDSTPAYYGFLNKESAWFIMREESSGTYKYKTGSSGFTSAWSGRAAIPEIEWEYYDDAF